jgi:hypothetical protein
LIGAAPALGMIAPAGPAAAATATHGAKLTAKRVSLGHSAAGTLAASGVTPATSCEGVTEVHQANSHYSNTFWYLKATSGVAICVGTVEGTWDTPPLSSYHPSFDFRIRVWSGANLSHLAYSTRNGASTTFSGHLKAGQTIRKWYGTAHGGPVQVCTAWVSNSGLYQDSVWIGPWCKTLP